MKNALEWTVFGISLALIVTVAALLLHAHFTAGDRPAAILLTTGDPIETGGGFAVPIEVRNDGDVTAEDVQLEATLTWPGGSQTGETALAFVPYRSVRRAWIAFSHDPRQGTLRARVLGYREP